MSEPTVVLEELARELSTYRIAGQVVDDAGGPVPSSSLNSLTLTLYVLDADNTIINGIDDVNILNADRGTVDASGNFVITLHPFDNPILDATLSEEIHRALVEWTYNGGADGGRQRIEFRVVNFERVS